MGKSTKISVVILFLSASFHLADALREQDSNYLSMTISATLSASCSSPVFILGLVLIVLSIRRSIL